MLKKDKLLIFELIYSLRLVNLKMWKIYLKINLVNIII